MNQTHGIMWYILGHQGVPEHERQARIDAMQAELNKTLHALNTVPGPERN